MTVTQLKNDQSVLRRSCGTDLPNGGQPVSARGPVRLDFRTDGSVTRQGFTVRFKVHQCGGNISEEVELSSPLHPDTYLHNTNCVWTIRAPTNKAVGIK